MIHRSRVGAAAHLAAETAWYIKAIRGTVRGYIDAPNDRDAARAFYSVRARVRSRLRERMQSRGEGEQRRAIVRAWRYYVGPIESL